MFSSRGGQATVRQWLNDTNEECACLEPIHPVVLSSSGLRSCFDSVLGNSRQNRLDRSQGRTDLGIGAHHGLQSLFCPLLAHLLNLPVLASPPDSVPYCVWTTLLHLTCLSVSVERTGLCWLHSPHVCGVWPECVSLHLVHCASHGCWKPMAPQSCVSARVARPLSCAQWLGLNA